jgi:hypothetical protein
MNENEIKSFEDLMRLIGPEKMFWMSDMVRPDGQEPSEDEEEEE